MAQEPTPEAKRAAAKLAALLDKADPTDDGPPEDDTAWKAAAMRDFLADYAHGASPSYDASHEIAEAFEILLGVRFRRRLALQLVTRWCEQRQGLPALIAKLRTIDNAIPRAFVMPAPHADKVLSLDPKRKNGVKGGAPVEPAAVLATIALCSGAFGFVRMKDPSSANIGNAAKQVREAEVIAREHRAETVRDNNKTKEQKTRRKRIVRDR